MMNESNSHSRVIANIRFPLMFGMLMSHAYGVVMSSGDYSYAWNVAGADMCRWMFDLCTYAIPQIVIPTFFTISGYLFFLKFGEDLCPKQWSWTAYLKKLVNRVYTLLIPYILWCLIPVIIGMLAAGYVAFNEGEVISESIREYLQGKNWRIFWVFYQDTDTTNVLGMRMPGTTAPFNFPLYYVRDLIGIILLSPVVFFYVRYTKWIGISFLVLCSFFGLLPNLPGLRSSAMLYFTFGALLSVWRYDYHRFFYKVLPIALISSCPTLLYILSGYPEFGMEWLVEGVYKISAVCAFSGILAWLTEHWNMKTPDWLSGSVFFIVVAHEGLYILNLVTIAVMKLFPETSCHWLFFEYWLTIIITLVLCVFLYVIIINYFPSLIFLTGSKKHRHTS